MTVIIMPPDKNGKVTLKTIKAPFLRCPYCGSMNIKTRIGSEKAICNLCSIPFRVKNLKKIYDKWRGKLYLFGKGYRLSPKIIFEKSNIKDYCYGLYNPKNLKCNNCIINSFCKHITINKAPKCFGKFKKKQYCKNCKIIILCNLRTFGVDKPL